MHKVVPQIQTHIQIPIIHIAEATADVLKESRIRKVALLGTKYTMTQDFYKKKLTDAGIEVLIPEQPDIETVNNVIFKELCALFCCQGLQKIRIRCIRRIRFRTQRVPWAP